MITFEQARQIALETIGPDCDLYDEMIVEKPYGWYFHFQSREYIQTGDFRKMLIGTGGFMVQKNDGSVFYLSATDDLEEWFAAYEAGLRFRCYDLTVRRLNDTEKAVELLTALGMMYVIPEEENGWVWKMPRQYTEVQIRQALSALPCTFSGTWFRPYDRSIFRSVLETFRAIDASCCCVYERTGRDDNPLAA